MDVVRIGRCISNRPRVALRHAPRQSSGRYGETGSAASTSPCCRMRWQGSRHPHAVPDASPPLPMGIPPGPTCSTC